MIPSRAPPIRPSSISMAARNRPSPRSKKHGGNRGGQLFLVVDQNPKIRECPCSDECREGVSHTGRFSQIAPACGQVPCGRAETGSCSTTSQRSAGSVRTEAITAARSSPPLPRGTEVAPAKSRRWTYGILAPAREGTRPDPPGPRRPSDIEAKVYGLDIQVPQEDIHPRRLTPCRKEFEFVIVVVQVDARIPENAPRAFRKSQVALKSS